MPQPNQDTKEEIKIKIRMTKFDCYLSQVYGQLMSPYVLIFLAIFLCLNYFDLKYFNFEKDHLVLAISVARNILWVLGLIYLFPVIILIFQITTNRLKGILGDHEFIFRENEFVEKTDYNEQSLTYRSVIKMLKVHNRYFICLQGGHSFLFHKNYLPENILYKIKSISKDTFKPKRFLIPPVAFILFVFSFIFIVSVYPLSKYTIIKTRFPFHITWNDQSLYIFGGEILSGQTKKYVTLPFAQDVNGNFSEPLIKTNLVLWVADHGEINKYELKNISNPGAIYLLDNELYFMSFDDSGRRKVFLWCDKAFQELKDTENIFAHIQKDIMHLSQKNFNIVNEFTWNEKAGKDGILEVLIGARPLMLQMKTNKNHENTSAPSEDFTLSANWPEQSNKFAIIFSDQYGQLKVDKKMFEDIFGL